LPFNTIPLGPTALFKFQDKAFKPEQCCPLVYEYAPPSTKACFTQPAQHTNITHLDL